MLYLYLAYWTTSGELSGEQVSLLNQAFSSLSTFFCDSFDSYCKSLQKRLGITINAIVQGAAREGRGVPPFPWDNSFRLHPPRNDSLAMILQSIVEDQHEYNFHSRSGDKQPFNILDKRLRV